MIGEGACVGCMSQKRASVVRKDGKSRARPRRTSWYRVFQTVGELGRLVCAQQQFSESRRRPADWQGRVEKKRRGFERANCDGASAAAPARREGWREGVTKRGCKKWRLT